MPEELLREVASEEASDQPVVISTIEDPPGLHVADRVERRGYRLLTPAPVQPAPVELDRFPADVDAAVAVTTNELTLPYRESVYITDGSGAPVAHTFDSAASCPTGRYRIELTTSVKLYLAVEAPVTVRHESASTTIDFGGPTTVRVGVCSPRRQPVGTITTTDDLDDLRTAIAHLSSALETTSPERSYPFRRAHPPLIELGEQASIPDYLVRADTGVTVEVRESLEDLFVAAPLAFYLGADMAWGDRRIVTDNGFSWSLGSAPRFEATVERVLKQTFLLDCLTRTEGNYPVRLDERQRFESRYRGRLDFQALYEQSIGDRLETYLGIPYRTVDDLVPAWSVTAYVDPRPDAVTMLPFLVDSLSTVRTGTPRQDEETGLDELLRRSGSSRSTEPAAHPTNSGSPIVIPDSDEALTTAWVGDGLPIGGVKMIEAGFLHRLEREPVDRDLRIHVVCAESEMRDELESVREIYESRPDLPFDVTVETGVTTSGLRGSLERETDFLHYIGHVDDRGFRCRDGWLDAADCTGVGADVFLLNSCRSHEQGEWLVRKGAIAGLVTVSVLPNHRAAAIGRTLAQFLNYGFPLYAALDIVRETYSFGTAYSLLGDPQMLLAQPRTTFPEYLKLSSQTPEGVSVVHQSFPSHRAGLGTVICPPYEAEDLHFLYGGLISMVTLSADELQELLSTPMPLLDEGELRFTVEAEDLDT